MATATPEISILPQHELDFNQELGIWMPMDNGFSLKQLDCGDKRPHTMPSNDTLTEIHNGPVIPGRFLGSMFGLATTAMVSFAAVQGDRATRQLLGEYDADAVTALAYDLAGRAAILGTLMSPHTDVTHEGNPHRFEPDVQVAAKLDIGCTFARVLGKLVQISATEQAYKEAFTMMRTAGVMLPLKSAREGAQILADAFPEQAAIDRTLLHQHGTQHAKEHGTHLHVGVLQADTTPMEATSLVADFAGILAQAQHTQEPGKTAFHHSVTIAGQQLPRLMPELNAPAQLHTAGAVLLGAATRIGLSGPNPAALRAEVIPPEYALRAA